MRRTNRAILTDVILLFFFGMFVIAASHTHAGHKVDDLIKKLQDKHPRVRAEAARELGKLKDSHAVSPLINSLKDSDAYVRAMAAEALGEIKDASAVPSLIATLQRDQYIYVRQEAAKALGKIKDARAVTPLINALHDECPDIREEAAKALTDIASPAIEPLDKALKENNVKLIADAYYFFVCRGEANTEALLIEALNKYGSKSMAIDFVYCGNDQLKEAALSWARSHGYNIQEQRVVGPGWGRCRR
jgi:HEAT repeat protein